MFDYADGNLASDYETEAHYEWQRRGESEPRRPVPYIHKGSMVMRCLWCGAAIADDDKMCTCGSDDFELQDNSK